MKNLRISIDLVHRTKLSFEISCFCYHITIYFKFKFWLFFQVFLLKMTVPDGNYQLYHILLFTIAKIRVALSRTVNFSFAIKSLAIGLMVFYQFPLSFHKPGDPAGAPGESFFSCITKPHSNTSQNCTLIHLCNNLTCIQVNFS